MHVSMVFVFDSYRKNDTFSLHGACCTHQLHMYRCFCYLQTNFSPFSVVCQLKFFIFFIFFWLSQFVVLFAQNYQLIFNKKIKMQYKMIYVVNCSHLPRTPTIPIHLQMHTNIGFSLESMVELLKNHTKQHQQNETRDFYFLYEGKIKQNDAKHLHSSFSTIAFSYRMNLLNIDAFYIDFNLIHGLIR